MKSSRTPAGSPIDRTEPPLPSPGPQRGLLSIEPNHPCPSPGPKRGLLSIDPNHPPPHRPQRGLLSIEPNPHPASSRTPAGSPIEIEPNHPALSWLVGIGPTQLYLSLSWLACVLWFSWRAIWHTQVSGLFERYHYAPIPWRSIGSIRNPRADRCGRHGRSLESAG